MLPVVNAALPYASCFIFHGSCHRADQGNILFDIVALLDDITMQKIKNLGGLSAIYFSHPHYYGTYQLSFMLTVCITQILLSVAYTVKMGSACVNNIATMTHCSAPYPSTNYPYDLSA